MIDLHCHILPGLDDGPETPVESLEMARVAHRGGVRGIVATPHTLNGSFRNRAERIIAETSAVQKQLIQAGLPIELYAGAEVHVCRGLTTRLAEGDAMTINNTGKYLLIELAVYDLPPTLKEEIFELRLKGITPIIAHPERNGALLRNHDLLFDLVGMEVLCQVTAMSVIGGFGKAVQAFSHWMLKSRLAHVIASDGHSTTGRPPSLAEAVECAADILRDHEEARRMVMDVPSAIVQGNPVDVAEPVRRRKWLWFG